MQIIGKDKIKAMHVHGMSELVELQSGAFQLGVGPSATLITDESQVASFPENVQCRVAKWLKGDGLGKAQQERTAATLTELAQSQPGALDQLAAAAESVIPNVTAKINAFLTSLLVDAGTIPARPIGMAEDSPGMRDISPAAVARFGGYPGALGERGTVKEVVVDDAEFDKPEPPETTITPGAQELLRQEQDAALASEQAAQEPVGAGATKTGGPKKAATGRRK